VSVILGLNCFHADAAACLLVDGRLVGAVAEERLGPRRKHSSAFPEHAVRWLLGTAGLRLSDLTHVAIPRRPHANRAAKAAWVLRHPWRGSRAALAHLRRSRATSAFGRRLAEACGEDPATLRCQWVPVEHHLAHIASAWYPSPYDDVTAAFSYDASGDFVSAMAARCEGTRIEVLDRVRLPHSLGFAYTAVCQLIGFPAFGEEYKVMGLSAYGQDTFAALFHELVELPPDGWFRLASGGFGMHEGGQSGAVDEAGRLVMGRLYTDALAQRLGGPAVPGSAPGQREMDLARSMQTRFEEAAVHCLSRLHRLVPSPRLVMAGGCALNGVANARILRDTPFEAMWLQPAASDDGTCLGAALFALHNVVGHGERERMVHAYWGPDHDDRARRLAAEAAGTPCRRLERGPLLEAVADHLAAGRVVGWHQGRSEWGPRALGNRSILADPSRADMKRVLNAKIKRRESFRPFAPTVLARAVDELFEQDVDSPFMMHVVRFRPSWRERLPAVSHVDGTGRLQTLRREQNPLYHDLIEALAARTGAPLVLNTSFNENEPIVDTPGQAVDCFLRTDMDVLVLGDHLLEKGPVAEEARGATLRPGGG
jgi:carbamoyltransferase